MSASSVSSGLCPSPRGMVSSKPEEEGSLDFDVIDPLLGKAAGAVASWPMTDLTPNYF
jgi:hypothetical protein